MESFTNAMRSDLERAGIFVTLGTFETGSRKNNPGSRDHMPAAARWMKSLPQEQAATAVVAGIGRDRRAVLLPRVFRVLFLLDVLFSRAAARLVVGG